MRTLEMSEMEMIEGGFNWGACGRGGGMLAYAYGNSPAVVFGLYGMLAAGLVGCVVSGYAME